MDLLTVLDLVGIFFFALSGGLVAVQHRLDIVGVVVLATVTGLGGGILRDVLLGVTPPTSIVDWWYLLVAASAGLITFWFHPAVGRRERVIGVFDAAGLGLFCVAGTLTALDRDVAVIPAALLGTITGVGGGVLRDLLVRRVPVVLGQSDLYAIPASVGALVVAGADALDLHGSAVAVPAALMVFGWRLLAMRRGWQAPMPPAS